MSKKNNNPYVRGNYNAIFAFWQKDCKGIATRQQLVDFAMTLQNKQGANLGQVAAEATVTVLLSPRLASNRGDPRGNFSAMGHVYYADLLKRPKGESQRFRLRFYQNALEPRQRPIVEQIAPTTKATKAKVKPVKEVKAKAKTAKTAKTAKRTRGKKVAEVTA